MLYDFSQKIERAGRDALAVDIVPSLPVEVKEGFDVIPMWVADMNFPVAASIQEAIHGRTDHPTFGYFFPREDYYQAILDWHGSKGDGNAFGKKEIGNDNGLLGALVGALQAFTFPGEAVLLHAPAYVGFTHVVETNGRRCVFSDLILDERDEWQIDYEDMDRKLKENYIHFAIFCSPHNPSGRVWRREELDRVMEIYRQNDCIVVSDEIWSDLTFPGVKHIPTQSVSEDAKMRTIACYAPSKTFNIAGLPLAYHVSYNTMFRDRLEHYSAAVRYNAMNVLAMHALIGAYTEEGRDWLNQLRPLLKANADYAVDFIRSRWKGVRVARPQGTYMLFLDCQTWCREHGVTSEELYERGVAHGVIWQDGRLFRWPDSIRMNLALPAEILKEAFDRLDRYAFV